MQSQARCTLQLLSTVAALIVAVPLSIYAQQNVEELGRFSWDGALQAVAVQDGIAYLGGETSLVVLDVSDPTSPHFLGELDLGHPVEDIAVLGAHAYVAGGGLSIVDVGDPSNPHLVAAVGETWSATGLSLAGGVAYVADGGREGGLRVLDVSDPAHPVEVSHYDALQVASDVTVEGGVAYVVDEVGLQTVDVGDPARPAALGTLDVASCATRVHVDGDVVYVGGACKGGRLWMVDVSDPAQPAALSSYGTPSCVEGIAVREDIVYASDGCRGGVWIIDVSDPADPQELVFYETQGPAPDITIAGETIYVVDHSGTLAMLRLAGQARQARMAVQPGMPESGSASWAGSFARALSLIGGLLVLLGCGLTVSAVERATFCGATRKRENGKCGEDNGH